MSRLRPCLWLVIGWVVGCSPAMDIQLIRYPEGAALSSSDDDCTVQLLGASAALADDCKDVGDVFVGDTGFSVGCDEERVLGEIRNAACRLGADTAVIRRIGDIWSTCYQARARLLMCPSSHSREDS
jgi:hypothetical protein